MARNVAWHAEKRSPEAIHNRFWYFGAQINDEGNVEIYRGYKENASIRADENKCLVLNQADTTNNPEALEIVQQGTGHAIVVRDDLSGTVQGYAGADGDWNNASSEKLKKNLRNMSDDRASDILNALEPKSFSFVRSGKKGFGPTAENFQAATGLGDGATINSANLAGLAIRFIQLAFKRLDALEAKVGLAQMPTEEN